MAGREPDDAPHPSHDDELEGKVARFDEDQRKRYDAQIDIAIQRNGETSRDYRIELGGTLLQNFPPHIEAQQVRDLNRREDARIQRQQSVPEPVRPERSPRLMDVPAPGMPSTTQSWRASAPAAQSPEKERAAPADPLQGAEPHGPPRDYTKLAIAHEHVASQLRGQQEARAAAPQPQQPEILSVHELQNLVQRYEQLRRDVNIVPSRGELLDRADLARAQEIDRQIANQKFGHGAPAAERQQATALMNQQHLAEQVGLDAKWIARHLKAQGLPDHGKLQNEASRAFQTARHIHAERQSKDPALERDQHARRGADAATAQQQNNAREAGQGSGSLSAEERVSAPAERHAGREDSSAAKSHAGKEITQPRDVRGPGRSPGSGGGRGR